MKKKNILTLIIYIFCGAAMAVPFINNNFWTIGWVAYAPIVLLELKRDKDEKHPYLKAWGRGLLFFMAFGLTAYHWLWSLYPMDFAGFDKTTGTIIVLLGWIGIPLLQGFVSAFNIVILRFCTKKNLRKTLIPVTVALTWIAIEWIHTLTWAGIPWTKLAVGQTGLMMNVQSAALLGSYFISFLMLLTSGILAIGLVKLSETKSIKKSIACFLLSLAIILSNSTYGFIVLANDKPYSSDDRVIVVGALQPNVETIDKWNNGDTLEIFYEYEKLTILSAFEGAQLVVWPETAYPYALNQNESLRTFTSEIAKKADTEILVGCLHNTKSNGQLYNALRLVSQDSVSDEIYFKQKPVPFGEFVPYRNIVTKCLPFLSEISMLQEDITAGKESTVLNTKSGKVGALICFDSIYESLAIESVRNGAEILAISTNDAWFRDSMATKHHTAQAQLRAIETGRYVVRSGNTGISAIISDRGIIQKSLQPMQPGYITAQAKLKTNTTPYVFFGNAIIVVAYLYLVIICLWLSFDKKKRLLTNNPNVHHKPKSKYSKNKKKEK